jgi:hypothetical protein
MFGLNSKVRAIAQVAKPESRLLRRSRLSGELRLTSSRWILLRYGERVIMEPRCRHHLFERIRISTERDPGISPVPSLYVCTIQSPIGLSGREIQMSH